MVWPVTNWATQQEVSRLASKNGTWCKRLELADVDDPGKLHDWLYHVTKDIMTSSLVYIFVEQ